MANLTLNHIKSIVQSAVSSATRWKPNLSVTDPDDPRYVVGADKVADKSEVSSLKSNVSSMRSRLTTLEECEDETYGIANAALPKADIIDNLNCSDKTKALSAAQGKVLDEKLGEGLSIKVDALDLLSTRGTEVKYNGKTFYEIGTLQDGVDSVTNTSDLDVDVSLRIKASEGGALASPTFNITGMSREHSNVGSPYYVLYLSNEGTYTTTIRNKDETVYVQLAFSSNSKRSVLAYCSASLGWDTCNEYKSVSSLKKTLERLFEEAVFTDDIVNNLTTMRSNLPLSAAQGKVVKGLIDNAQTTADNAQSTADNAQTTADNAQSTADNAQSTADNAQSTADNAQSTADNAQSTADNAQSTADNAQSTADNAQTTADNAQTTADNVRNNFYELTEFGEVTKCNTSYDCYVRECEVVNGIMFVTATASGDSGFGLKCSLDGITWNDTNLSLGTTTVPVYGKNVFVTSVNKTSDDGIYYSEDGITWTKSVESVGFGSSIYYNNGTFVVGNRISGEDDYEILYSKDGIIWEKTNVPNPTKRPDFSFFNGMWFLYITGEAGYLYVSKDATTWEKINWGNDADSIKFFTYTGGIFFIGSYSNGIYYSYDGTNWLQSNIQNADPDSILYNNGVFVAKIDFISTDSLYYSQDGASWSVGSNNSSFLSTPAYGNNVWVVGTKEEAILYSSDGMNWEKAIVPFSYHASAPLRVSYINGVFIAYCDYGAWYSYDGKTWCQTKVEYSKNYYLSLFDAEDGLFLVNYGVSAEDSCLWYSFDGTFWRKKELGTKVSAFAYKEGVLSLVSREGFFFLKKNKKYATPSDLNDTKQELLATIEESRVEVDDTLSKSGAAADAKVTGEKIAAADAKAEAAKTAASAAQKAADTVNAALESKADKADVPDTANFATKSQMDTLTNRIGQVSTATTEALEKAETAGKTASAAQTTADEAQDAANKASIALESKADKTAVEAAQSTADTAKNNAVTAQSTANAAQTAASKAQTAAEAAQSSADAAQEQIRELSAAYSVTPEAFGAAGDGVTDDSAAITQAMASGKTVVFGGEGKTYAIGSTITIPAGARVDFCGATIIPKGNHDLIRVKPGAHISNLVVKCTDVEDWEASVLVFSGEDAFRASNPTKIENAKLYNDVTYNDGEINKGNGVRIFVSKPGEFVEGLAITDLMTLGFGKGVYIHGMDADEEPGNGSVAFAGANNFCRYWSFKDTYGIYIDSQHEQDRITNNFFSDLNIQSDSYGGTLYGIYCNGFANRFSGCLYDFFWTNPNDPVKAIFFGQRSNSNVVETMAGTVYDAGYVTDLGIMNRVTNLSSLGKIQIPNSSNYGVSMCGNQDDILAYADKNMTCTLESLDSEPYYGSLANVFDPTPRKVLSYAELTAGTSEKRARITISLPKAVEEITNIVLQFVLRSEPKSVKITLYGADEVRTIYNVTDNRNHTIIVTPVLNAYTGYASGVKNVAKIVVELGGFANEIGNNGIKEWTLERISATASDAIGKTWMNRSGGKVYGNIEFAAGAGPVIAGEDGKKYRLTVNGSGALTATEVTNAEEEAPEVAVLVPTLKPGSTWYDEENAGEAQENITSVTFSAEYTPTGEEDATWFCDDGNSGHIVAYRTGGDVVIVPTTGSDKIKINKDSTYMFANDGTTAKFAKLAEVTGTEMWVADANTSMNRVCMKNTALKKPISIPSGVNDVRNAFYSCSALSAPPVFPEGVTALGSVCIACSSLPNLPELPSTASNIEYAFQSCTAAVSTPSTIPAKMTNVMYAFRNCQNLSGTIHVAAENITSYEGCFLDACKASGKITLTGSSPILAELAATNKEGKVEAASE